MRTIPLTLLFLWLCSPVVQAQKASATSANTMNTIPLQDNAAIVREIYHLLNTRDFGRLTEFIAPDYIGFQGTKGPEAFAAPVRALITAFPDIQWQLPDVVAEGNTVMLRWEWKGTQQATFNGIPATGKTITNTAMAIYELKNGQIITVRVLTDRLGFLQALGVLPAEPNQLAAAEGLRFIDRFSVPKAAIAEFKQRMAYNREFIRHLPGFIWDEAFEQSDADGNLQVLTIAFWQNQQALEAAKEKVLAEYQRIGFHPQEFYQSLGIRLDRGIYTPLQK